ncbi:MAG: prepilin-type N-terminal cleavage/methylation domain-containing protein [Candidatus Omnitrophica bacterium]|nr:prepilin-type N-terminal cleavage/methylation domain-containing protein [Candidatus Omnitrophota bacterium]
MMSHFYLLNKKGFALLEVLIGVIILSVGLFTVGAVFFGEFGTINKLSETLVATLAVQEEIDKIRALPFNNIAAYTCSGYNAADPMCPSGFKYLANKSPVCTVLVDGCANAVDNFSGDANIKKVSVTATWNSASGRILSKSLVTLITYQGIDKW